MAEPPRLPGTRRPPCAGLTTLPSVRVTPGVPAPPAGWTTLPPLRTWARQRPGASTKTKPNPGPIRMGFDTPAQIIPPIADARLVARESYRRAISSPEEEWEALPRRGGPGRTVAQFR